MLRHHVELSALAFAGFERRASAVGLTVNEYLDRIGMAIPQADGFVMTPELHTAIQAGIDEADRGELVSLEKSESDLREFKAKWRAERR